MSGILKGLQLNELSNDTLASYKKKAGADATASDKAGDTKKADKRFSGIVKATKKEFANDAKKVKEDKWNPITGGDFPTDYTSGDTTPSPAKFQAMLDYHGNNMNVIRALDDLYRNAQSGSYYDSTVRQDRYLATIEFPRTGKTEKRYAKTKREAYEYAKGYNGVVTSIEKIDTQEDTSDLITLPVMLGIKDHKKKWMLQFPSEAYAQKWEFKHKNVAKILWDEQHALYSPEPEAKPETEKDQEDDEPGKYGYDTETGKPLKKGEQSSRPQQGNRPQQSSRPQQYHTSQQVGYTKPSKYNKDDVTDVEVKEAGNEMIQGELMPVTRQYWQKAVLARYPDARFFQQKMMNGATIARDESGQVGIYDPKNSYAKVGPSDESNVEEAYNNYHANRTGFSRGQRDDERHDLDKPTQVWGLKINGKVWSKGGVDVTFNSKEAALNIRNSILKNRPDLEIGLVTKGGVAEGEGNFVGDTPVNLGGVTVKRLQVGDIVKYFGQKAKILAMSKTGNTSRITIANDMGGVTKDVLTSDLKRTSVDEEKQRLDPKCWTGYKKQGTKMKGGVRVNNCVPKESKSHILAGLHQIDEGWKEKLGAAALAGSMALGAGAAHSRVTPDGQGGFTGGLKPSATVTAPTDKPAAEAPKGFSKEYLQSIVNGKHPRPMISVEKAQELLKNMP